MLTKKQRRDKRRNQEQSIVNIIQAQSSEAYGYRPRTITSPARAVFPSQWAQQLWRAPSPPTPRWMKERDPHLTAEHKQKIGVGMRAKTMAVKIQKETGETITQKEIVEQHPELLEKAAAKPLLYEGLQQQTAKEYKESLGKKIKDFTPEEKKTYNALAKRKARGGLKKKGRGQATQPVSAAGTTTTTRHLTSTASVNELDRQGSIPRQDLVVNRLSPKDVDRARAELSLELEDILETPATPKEVKFKAAGTRGELIPIAPEAGPDFPSAPEWFKEGRLPTHWDDRTIGTWETAAATPTPRGRRPPSVRRATPPHSTLQPDTPLGPAGDLSLGGAAQSYRLRDFEVRPRVIQHPRKSQPVFQTIRDLRRNRQN